jgi:tetratricopeptide (TPR) repeat protein
MSSHLRVSLIAFILIFSSVGFNQLTLAQHASQPQPPAQSTQKSPKEEAPDYSQEALVIEQMKLLYRFEKDGTGLREQSFRARIQSEAAVERFGQLVFPYSSANEKLDIDFVRVRKPDGTVITSSETDVQDLSAPIAREAPVYTDLRQKHVTVRGLRPGDVIEYHILWQIPTPLARNHFWLEHDFVNPGTAIVLDEQLEVNIPLDSKVKLKTEPGKDPTIKDQDERRIYTWKYASLKRVDKDDSARKKSDEDDEPKPPQVQMTTFQNWSEVGQWYAELERDRVSPDEHVRAKAMELVRGLSTDKEKIEALYEFVAKNFRYVSLSLGQGRYQPHAAADVLSNQYGDCKDKHTLLSSMLRAAGLRAYPALMNSGREIDAEMPSPGQFDHVITAVPLAGAMLWMDTTAEVAPFGLLAPQLRDKKALMVLSDAPAALETTPAEPPFLSTEVIEITGEVNDLGKLAGHSHMTLRGDTEMLFRILFRKTPKTDWKHIGFYLSVVGGVRGQEVTEIKPGDPAALEKPFEVDYDFADDSFLNWSSKKERLGLPLPTVRMVNMDPDKQEGSKPIQLGPPIDVTYRLKLTLPAKYQTRIPLPLKVTRDYADYSSSYKLEGNTLLVERRFRLNRHELPAARTQDYIAFVAAARADEAQSLSLETDVAGTPAIPDTVKVEELIQAAEAAAKNSNYPMAEELLKRVLEKEPKQKDVRRQLGWALFVQQKYDAAIEVLREQTKINPFDNYSYNLLGRVYWAQQNYQDAESAFRKQIEITPLDQYVHANLGQMLVEWRKYQEAVPELEQAISLNPEGELLYVSLGRAYLNVGEAAKGTEAFEKAVKLAPGPLVWNDVSYNLALSKVQLDKAQQYAESAVTTTATELRNLELDQLTMRDLQRVAAIAAYWDTLGWVYFQKGELETAEKYISAAWALEQHSEVGTHLGQILEKRGKSAEAIRIYALAAVATRLVPEASESLIRLAGKERSTELLNQASNELREIRTVKFASGIKSLKSRTEAQFYVVLVPGPTRNAQVADVKFIRGDEKLVPLSAGLKTANFNFSFPSDTTTKVIRRGTLFCLAGTGDCSFIMLSPDGITSLD